MLSSRAGQPVRRTQLNSYTSIESVGASDVVSEDAGESAITTGSEVGFEEAELVTESSYEPGYQVTIAVTGFAPTDTDYFEEIAEDEFPKVQSSAYILGKRVFDIVFSFIAIAVTSPLLALIAIAIKLSSEGPVLFVQDRVGLRGKTFKMLKFRTMYLNDRCDTEHTFMGDPRITKVGAILRRSSLDELPQFFNVLKGEMSVVGPRPELVRFVERFELEIPRYMDRHAGIGGITGWAQINGFRSSETSIPIRIEYDLEYLRNWSFWLDLKIIARTIARGFIHNAF